MAGIIIYKFGKDFYSIEIGNGMQNDSLYKSEVEKLKSRGINPYFAQTMNILQFRKVQEKLPEIMIHLDKDKEIDVKKEISDCF